MIIVCWVPTPIIVLSFIIIIISTINIILKMSHQNYGAFLMQELEFGDLMPQYDLEEVNFCDFRFTLSDFHPQYQDKQSRVSRLSTREPIS